MSYEYREVICPYCKHQFMFRKNEGGVKVCDYIDKITGTKMYSVICTSCGKWLKAMENVLEGVREDDDRILTRPIYDSDKSEQ